MRHTRARTSGRGSGRFAPSSAARLSRPARGGAHPSRSARRWRVDMRRALRIVGTLLAVAGVLTLVWAFVVWQWMDPFTALYTRWKQHQLSAEYHKREAAFHALSVTTGPSLASERLAIAREAKRYRGLVGRGHAI